MTRVLITGSSDGIGLEAARVLAGTGHQVVLHARNEQRARTASTAVPDAERVVVGDLTTVAGATGLAAQVRETGVPDTVIFNAGVGFDRERTITADGVEHVFAINVLSPYVLTALLPGVSRLIYVSSRGHHLGDADLSDLAWTRRAWNPKQAYADSKLFDVMLALAVARRRPDAAVNAIAPRWIRTKLGGSDAAESITGSADTYAWLATTSPPASRASGGYYVDCQPADIAVQATDLEGQDALLAVCADLSGLTLNR